MWESRWKFGGFLMLYSIQPKFVKNMHKVYARDLVIFLDYDDQSLLTDQQI